MKSKGHRTGAPSAGGASITKGVFFVHKGFYRAAALLPALVTFIVFLPALANEFLLGDDFRLIIENPNIRSLDFGFLKWAFSNVVISSWYPLTLGSFALDYALWGLDPWGFHLTNNILHSLNTLLVFILVSRLVRLGAGGEQGGGGDKTALIAALVTALFFGVHPLRVESVAWVAERKDVLYGFFYLLSVLAYLRYASGNSRKAVFYPVALVFFALSLMSKAMAVTLPAVLLILDFYPLKRISLEGGLRSTGKVVLEKVPFFILGLSVSLLTVFTHLRLIPQDESPLAIRIISAVSYYMFYIYKMVLPVNLAPFYPRPEEIDILSAWYLVSICLFAALTALCLWSLKKHRLFSVVWLYYVVTLLPVIRFLQVGEFAAADRYTYLPSLGPFVLAGLAAAAVFQRSSKNTLRALTAVTVLLVSSLFATLTVRQTALWRDSITLWSHEIKIFPDSIHPGYYFRALAYSGQGMWREAAEDLGAAIRIDPGNPEVYSLRGRAYGRLAMYLPAIKDYSTAVALDPDYIEAFNSRGVTYGRLGKYRLAIKDFERVIELNPDYINAYRNLEQTYSMLGDMQRSVFYSKKVVELENKETRDR